MRYVYKIVEEIAIEKELVAFKPDIDLLEMQACQGDADSFGKLIRIYDDNLRAVAWSVVKTQTDLEDVMQSAYEKAFKSITKFNQNSSMKTWLYSIVYRTALNHVRHKNYRKHQDIDTVYNISSSFSTSEKALSKVQIEQVFKKLNEEERVLMTMIYGLGFTFEETAQAVGLKKDTVGSKVKRAKSKLQKGFSYE